MVVVELMGGLGNQMFQYALGRCLSVHRNDELFLYLARVTPEDSDQPVDGDHRKFALSVFNTRVQITTREKLQHDGAHLIWIVMEPGFGYFPEVLTDSACHKHLGLRGWWQSEKYFQSIADLIRAEFSFKTTFRTPHDTSLIEMVKTLDSVCVHIRRTDYLRAEDDKGWLGLDYYQRAMEMVRARVAHPHLFMFSDDIAWCKENIDFPFPTTYVESRNFSDSHAADDFSLMTQCRYFVIANSTYSWWAAWLAKHPDKFVIAPHRWFRSEEGNTPNPHTKNSSSLVPETWTRI